MSTVNQESNPLENSSERIVEYGLGPMDRWYVAMTAPRKERTAAANLNNQKFRTFLPLHRVTIRHARKFKTEYVPVFARYIFVALDVDAQRWRSVNGTLGVVRLLTDGERPLAVKTGIVETLILSSDPKGALVFRADVSVGDKVRLLAGPFADTLGVLERLDGAGRVQLILDLIGGPRKVSVPRDMIAAR